MHCTVHTQHILSTRTSNASNIHWKFSMLMLCKIRMFWLLTCFGFVCFFFLNSSQSLKVVCTRTRTVWPVNNRKRHVVRFSFYLNHPFRSNNFDSIKILRTNFSFPPNPYRKKQIFKVTEFSGEKKNKKKIDTKCFLWHFLCMWIPLLTSSNFWRI